MANEPSEDPLRYFKSEDDLHRFADWFVHERIETFSKDMAICLKPARQVNHSNGRVIETRCANMPALMNCISLLELLSCLHAGELKGGSLRKIRLYAQDFLADKPAYTGDALDILYEGFRHKIAHATQPYGSFDTHSVEAKKHALKERPRRFVTWRVWAKTGLPAITMDEMLADPAPRSPWPIPCTHRCTVGLPTLAEDIVASAIGENGYLKSLHRNAKARAHFAACMREFFPWDMRAR